MTTNNIGNNLQLSLLQQTPAVQKTAIDGNNHATDKAAPPHAPVVENDQTSLSHASTLLAQALTTSDVRTEKVASLQQAIASGSYNVSSSDVADKLMGSLLE